MTAYTSDTQITNRHGAILRRAAPDRLFSLTVGTLSWWARDRSFGTVFFRAVVEDGQERWYHAEVSGRNMFALAAARTWGKGQIVTFTGTVTPCGPQAPDNYRISIADV